MSASRKAVGAKEIAKGEAVSSAAAVRAVGWPYTCWARRYRSPMLATLATRLGKRAAVSDGPKIAKAPAWR